MRTPLLVAGITAASLLAAGHAAATQPSMQLSPEVLRLVNAEADAPAAPTAPVAAAPQGASAPVPVSAEPRDALREVRAAMQPLAVTPDQRLAARWLTPQALDALTVMALRARCGDPRVSAQTLERAAAVIHGIVIPELSDKSAQAAAFLKIHRHQRLRSLIDHELQKLEVDCEELQEFPAADIQQVSKAGAAIVANATSLVGSGSPYTQAVEFADDPAALTPRLRKAVEELQAAVGLLKAEDALQQVEIERQRKEMAERERRAKEIASRPPVRVFHDVAGPMATQRAE